MNLDVIEELLKVVCLAASVAAVLMARSARRGCQKARKAIEQADATRMGLGKLNESERLKGKYKDGN